MEDADTSIYLSGAKSIAEGNGYRYAAHANTPRITMVPPLQSVFLAAFWKLRPTFPQNMDVLYAGMIFIAVVFFSLVLFYWRRESVPFWAGLPVILFWGMALSWVFLIYWFLSDILFATFWILLALHWRSKESLVTPRWWLVTSFLMVPMFLTRTAALAPIGALGLAALCSNRENRWKNTLVYAIPVALAMFCWSRWISTNQNQNYGGLVSFFREVGGGWLGLAKYCLSTLVGYASGNTFILSLAPNFYEEMTAPGRFNSATGMMLVLCLQAAGMLFMFLWIYGVWKLGSRNEKWLAFVVVAYLVQVGLWPYDFSTRGSYPVFAILLPWAWRGGAALAQKFRITVPVRIAVLPLAFIICLTNLQLLQQRIDTWQRQCRFDELKEVAAWVRHNTPPDAKVASTWVLPNLYFSEYSQRQIVTDYFRHNLTWEPVSHAAQNFVQADYILTSYKWDLDVPKAERHKYQLVKVSNQWHYHIYRVLHDGEAKDGVGDVAGAARDQIYAAQRDGSTAVR